MKSIPPLTCAAVGSQASLPRSAPASSPARLSPGHRKLVTFQLPHPGQYSVAHVPSRLRLWTLPLICVRGRLEAGR
jgi:hypothetical protein